MDDELIVECDTYFFNTLCTWFLAAWQQEICANIALPSYFLRMGDDRGGTVFDLRLEQEVPWETMYLIGKPLEHNATDE